MKRVFVYGSAGLIILTVVAVELHAEADAVVPDPLVQLIAQDHQLPRYHERYYHPLGRNPVTDVLLGDPLYAPTYGRQVSQALRKAANEQKLAALMAAALRGGGVPIGAPPKAAALPIPEIIDQLGEEASQPVLQAWGCFLTARKMVIEALAPLTPDERQWLGEHPDAYFFGEESAKEMAFLTHDTTTHLKIFRLAAKVDLVKLAEADLLLATAVDHLRAGQESLSGFSGRLVYEQDGLTLLVAGNSDDQHLIDVDFLIDTGGNDRYRNNAGGTRGQRPATLLVDLSGDDRYEGGFATQGAGFVGVGGLADLAGDDVYRADEDFAQGIGYFGSGFICDHAGDDVYRGGFFTQSAAMFGFSLLWDQSGDDTYRAAGYAQAATTTLGVAFLVESQGNDDFRISGESIKADLGMGIGQGAGVGTRHYPWIAKPAFYGGLGFIDDAQGDDRYWARDFGQGGGYTLGTGIMVATGGDDVFEGRSDVLGATIHLAGGLFIKEGGNDRYTGSWGSMGVGGDRGFGIFIDTGGEDRYYGQGHNIGSARKPKGVGLFIDVAGDDRYDFFDDSCAHVLPPMDPEGWAFALFLDLTGQDRYPSDYDGLHRGNGRSWAFQSHGHGLDTTIEQPDLAAAIFETFPTQPRAAEFPFDPLNGWDTNVSHRPLIKGPWTFPPDQPKAEKKPSGQEQTQPAAEQKPPANQPATAEAKPIKKAPLPIDEWLSEIMTSDDYDRRRQLYETLDLARFTQAGPDDWSCLARLLSDPTNAPVDRLAFAATWCDRDKTESAIDYVADALIDETIASDYARRLIIRMVGEIGGERSLPVLRDRALRDLNALCRREAAHYLGQLAQPADLKLLKKAASDPAEVVRFAMCQGLRESALTGAADVVKPLMTDPSLYVRREAAMTAISVGYADAMDKLLEDLKVRTLDTLDNYGHNQYATLSRYVGQELGDQLGLDRDKWADWWHRNKHTFDLPAAIAKAKAQREKEEQEKNK